MYPTACLVLFRAQKGAASTVGLAPALWALSVCWEVQGRVCQMVQQLVSACMCPCVGVLLTGRAVPMQLCVWGLLATHEAGSIGGGLVWLSVSDEQETWHVAILSQCHQLAPRTMGHMSPLHFGAFRWQCYPCFRTLVGAMC